MSKKNSLTPPEIDPGTVRLVAQRLNHYATPGSLYWSMRVLINIPINRVTLGKCNLFLQLSLMFYGCNVQNILRQGR